MPLFATIFGIVSVDLKKILNWETSIDIHIDIIGSIDNIG
jgi:hypothetical protein